MLGKDAILAGILNECDICTHLFTKIPEGTYDFRPTPDQRSMHELLQYLSYCGIGGTRAMAEGNWDGYQEVSERGKQMKPEEFPAAMERQKAELTEYFDGLTQEEVETRTATTPIGEELTLEQALFQLPLRWMTGYRMQLFLYAKQAGNKDIWTPNCWAGVDWDKPKPEELPDEEVATT